MTLVSSLCERRALRGTPRAETPAALLWDFNTQTCKRQVTSPSLSESPLLDVSFDAMVREGGVEAANEGVLSTKTTSTSTEFGEGRETRHPGREQPRVSRALSTSARAGGGVGREINDRVAR